VYLVFIFLRRVFTAPTFFVLKNNDLLIFFQQMPVIQASRPAAPEGGKKKKEKRKQLSHMHACQRFSSCDAKRGLGLCYTSLVSALWFN
jgi:hypothetical protein